MPVTTADGGTVTDLSIRQDRFRGVFAADVPREVAALMAATQRPVVAGALEEEATRTAWEVHPVLALVTTQDLAIPADSMRSMAERAGSRTVEVDASHAVPVSRPGAAADLVREAARTT